MISPTLENYGGKKLISLPEQYLKEAIDSGCFKLHVKFLWTIRAEDLLVNMLLIEAKLKEKDLIVMCDVGAYGMSLSSNYNVRAKPPEILIKGSKIYVIRKRQKLDDLI